MVNGVSAICACLTGCQVCLRSWCSSDDHTGYMCLNHAKALSTSGRDACGVYISIINVDRCRVSNVTRFTSTSKPSMQVAVNRYLAALPTRTVIAMVSTCDVKWSDVASVLAGLGVTGTTLHGNVKLAVITQIGHTATKTQYVAAMCGTHRDMQLCLSISGTNNN